jgi:hypothetical protein
MTDTKSTDGPSSQPSGPLTNKIDIGVINATGYVLRKATVRLVSDGGLTDPSSSIDIEVQADVVWVNKDSDSWITEHPIKLYLDIDNEQFVDKDGSVLDIINKKEIFDGIMKMFVTSMRKS